MSYSINAWLENGKPHLMVTDTHSGQPRVIWESHLLGAISDIPPVDDQPELLHRMQLELQQLFKQLILLSSATELAQHPSSQPYSANLSLENNHAR